MSTTTNTRGESEAEGLFRPPDYETATSLPTYDEAERSKAEECHQNSETGNRFSHQTYIPSPTGIFEPNDSELLGSDISFMFAFLVGFLFNWIGFLLVLCFLPTIAGRCGALAGFGLSLAKWVAVFHYRRWHAETGHFASDSWIWWIFVLFGLLICLRGVWHYLTIKRSWPTMSSEDRQQAFHFY